MDMTLLAIVIAWPLLLLVTAIAQAGVHGKSYWVGDPEEGRACLYIAPDWWRYLNRNPQVWGSLSPVVVQLGVFRRKASGQPWLDDPTFRFEIKLVIAAPRAFWYIDNGIHDWAGVSAAAWTGRYRYRTGFSFADCFRLTARLSPA